MGQEGVQKQYWGVEAQTTIAQSKWQMECQKGGSGQIPPRPSFRILNKKQKKKKKNLNPALKPPLPIFLTLHRLKISNF